MSATHSYIVLLKEDAPTSTNTHLEWIRKEESKVTPPTDSAPEYTFQVGHRYDLLKGYSATLTDTALKTLQGCGDVAHIIEDSHPFLCGDSTQVHTLVIEGDAPWGLQRISSREPLPEGSSPDALTYQYRWTSSLKPSTVDVYVIDTGVYLEHEEFAGRARWGKTIGPYKDVDIDGHGTQVAGIVAGRRFGVAKNMNIVAVKVLEENSPYSKTSDIIAGIEWVRKEVERTKTPGVINISIGVHENLALDQAATRAVRAGIPVCAAAGNMNMDAEVVSPARAEGVIAVGAMSIDDTVWALSDFGKRVDLWAPGDAIATATIGSPKAQTSVPGTSMASPHVAGVLAWLISSGDQRPPADLLEELKRRSCKVETPDPLGDNDTLKLLLNNGV